ncbi:MAG: methyl-accepting chemotaxis protein, partial [Pseudomonadaceae bacterium]|nr:methyl-accepting chemotaxis protein [Pseudomonadaceae bacterium]
MSIKLRLLLLTATGLFAALLMGLVSYLNNGRTAEAISANQTILTALRNHLDADMMHDALRADVLSALLVGLGKSSSSSDEVRSSIQEHAARFRQTLGDNQQ